MQPGAAAAGCLGWVREAGDSLTPLCPPMCPDPSRLQALDPHFTNKKSGALAREPSSTERSQAHPSSWLHQLYDPTCPRTVQPLGSLRERLHLCKLSV